MVLYNILIFNVDIVVVVKLKLLFKVGSGILCVGVGLKLWLLFGIWKELLENFLFSVFFSLF